MADIEVRGLTVREMIEVERKTGLTMQALGVRVEAGEGIPLEYFAALLEVQGIDVDSLTVAEVYELGDKVAALTFPGVAEGKKSGQRSGRGQGRGGTGRAQRAPKK